MSAPPPSPLGSARGALTVGIVTVLAAFGGLGTWAAVAPLHSAAVAVGQVTVDSYRKTIQHLEGGIIGEIAVRDGDEVAAGDVLVRLDDTRLRASHRILINRLREGLARQARLAAERDDAAAVAFPKELLDQRSDPEVADVIEGQRNLFQARRQLLAGQIAVLQQRNQQYAQEVAALDAQQQAMRRQLDLVSEEIATVAYLVRSGLGQKPRLLALQREAARLEGERGEHLARMARVRQSMAGTELEIINLRNRRMEEVAADDRETEMLVHDTRQELAEIEDSLRRTVVRAPKPGIVVNMRFHTTGGVVGPGEAILDIVPDDDRLVVEARVRPEDIDVVHPGLAAQVRLTAFKQRLTPTADGTVITVSADRLADPVSGEAYYLARISLDDESLSRLPAELYPGMPAEALILTGRRTAFDYIASPITQALPRAWRED
ncbi:MAG: HlyD family type I secretion periplasmic adaptor subunit [Rhodospirillales bacterium]|nr:HlyD family type I secretion periplasmic adaptor subunit [Rhodospirillales bacterium]